MKVPEQLEFISHYADRRRPGLRYNASMLSSAILHGLLLWILILNPHWLLGRRNWASGNSDKPDTSGKQYEVITYVPTSDKPMYMPRRPVGDLYSTRDALAFSRPPKPKPGGNMMPYSRGTTKEPMITDIVRELDLKKARRPEEKPKPAEAEAAQNDSKSDPGVSPVIETPAATKPPSPTAMAIPPKPKEIKPPQIGEASSAAPSADKARDERDRQRVAEEVAKQLKDADKRQQIFDNEASALDSPGPGFFDTKGFELSDYTQIVVDRIKQNWLIPGMARSERGRSTIIFYIERDGQISGLRVVSKSGIQQLDYAAMNSILVSGPFPPLPSKFSGDHIGAKLVFSYNEVRDSP